MFQVPFSEHTRDLVLDKLSDMNFVQDLCDDMHSLFEVSIPLPAPAPAPARTFISFISFSITKKDNIEIELF